MPTVRRPGPPETSAPTFALGGLSGFIVEPGGVGTAWRGYAQNDFRRAGADQDGVQGVGSPLEPRLPGGRQGAIANP